MLLFTSTAILVPVIVRPWDKEQLRKCVYHVTVNLKHILASLQDGGGWDKKWSKNLKGCWKCSKQPNYRQCLYITAFWHVTSCTGIDTCQSFKQIPCLHVRGKKNVGKRFLWHVNTYRPDWTASRTKRLVSRLLKKFPYLFEKPKVHHRVRNSSTYVFVLSYINWIHAIPTHIFKSHFSIILPYTPRYSKWSLVFKFLQKNPKCISLLPRA